MKQIIISMLLTSSVAMAGEYKQFYTDARGTRVTETEALTKAMKGEEIVKCQTVEAKVSKRGTSISLHNVKKPKQTKD